MNLRKLLTDEFTMPDCTSGNEAGLEEIFTRRCLILSFVKLNTWHPSPTHFFSFPVFMILNDGCVDRQVIFIYTILNASRLVIVSKPFHIV